MNNISGVLVFFFLRLMGMLMLMMLMIVLQVADDEFYQVPWTEALDLVRARRVLVGRAKES